MDVSLEEVVKMSTKYAFGMVKELLDSEPRYMTRRAAEKKYKHLLFAWETKGLVKAIHTMNGKHDVFPEHRLIELYEDYVAGR